MLFGGPPVQFMHKGDIPPEQVIIVVEEVEVVI